MSELVTHLVAPEQRSHLPPDGATFLLANFLIFRSLEAEAFELEPPGGAHLVPARGQSQVPGDAERCPPEALDDTGQGPPSMPGWLPESNIWLVHQG